MSKKQDTIQDDPNAPRNDFLPFAATSTANVLDQAAYQSLEARTGGFVAGVAKSAQLNKVWRQSSIMAASLGQYINNRTGQDVVDDGDIQKLAGLIEMAVKKTSGGGIPLGGIIAWSGAKANIPAGYSLCDGNNGTPNLVGRFIFGGAEKGAAGGSAKIAVEQLPPHTHTGTAADAGTHTHTGGSSPAGGHSHGISDSKHQHDTGFYRGMSSGGGRGYISEGGNIPVQPASAGVSIQGVGDHTHAMALDNAGNHSHALSLNNTGGGQDYLPPYFQLCYIMRTSEE